MRRNARGRYAWLVARNSSQMPHVFSGGAYLLLDTEVTVPGGAVAFARSAQGPAATRDVVIFAAPRLCRAQADGRSTAPLGGDWWKTSRIMLPADLADRTFRHELTGAEIRPTRDADTAWIFLGETFNTVPMAILRTT